MKPKKKLILVMVIFFIVHLILQLLTLLFIAASIHTSIELGEIPWWENIVYVPFRIFSFPMLNLAEIIDLSYATWGINSVIWTLGFYFLIKNRFKK